jgi:hypothetical protein
MATATDTCDMAPVIAFTDVVVAGVGNNSVITRTWTATDANTNASSCVQVITVTDTMAPAITCPADLTVACDASTLAADTGMATATDNCDMAPVIAFTDVVVAGVGNNSVITRTWTATDANMNASSCVQVITVTDTTAPTAICAAPFTVQLDAMGMASITVADIENGSTDNCGMITTTIDVMDFTCADVGAPVTVTLTVTDENMNSSTCTTLVTVEDTMPIVITSGPIDIFTGTGAADGDCATIVNYDPITVDDFVLQNNCGDNASITIAQTGGLGSGAAFPVGINTEEYTLTDVNGNDTVYTFTVTITDTTLPVIDCPGDLIVSDGGTGEYTIEDYTATVTDNCSSGADLVVTQDPVAGTIVAALSTTTVTVTATDASGNVASCEFDILVDETLSVDDTLFNGASVSMYPNPTNGELNISAGNVTIDKVEVYDLSGRLVKRVSFDTNNYQFSLNDVDAAVYLVQIYSGSNVVVKRVIKN